MPQLSWLITGCSPNGLGEELAFKALAKGDKVVATARNGTKRLGSLKDAGAIILDLDVTWSPTQLQEVADKAIAEVGGSIDVLINNAGYIEAGAAELLTDEKMLKSIQSNVLGPLNLTRAMLPHFRHKKSGTVVFISSIAAHMQTQLAGSCAYSACKSFIETAALVLQEETATYGIRYCCVVAGFLRTKIFNKDNMGRSTLQQNGNDYAQFNEAILTMCDQVDGNEPGDPAKAAQVIVDAVRGEGPGAGRPLPFRLPVGAEVVPILQARANALLEANQWEDIAGSIGL